LRLTFVIESLGGGGAQRVVSALSGALVNLGQAVSVITYADDGPDRFALDPRVERLSGQLGGVSPNALAAAAANVRRIVRLRALVCQTRPDVVIGLVGSTNILTILACTGLGIPVVISERNDPARQSLGRIWDMLRRQLYRHATIVSANSLGALATMRAYVPDAKLIHMPNPLPPCEGSWMPELRNPFVLAVGRLTRQKGFDVLIDAFARFASGHPGWRLVLLGEGPDRAALNERAARLGIAEFVRFAGFVVPTGYYRRCRMFVLPSRHEGVSNALLEAMGHGVPAIISTAQKDALDHDGAGDGTLVVPTEDPQALADAMSRLAADDMLSDKLGDAARRAVTALEPERVARQWLAMCEEAVRRYNAPATVRRRND